MSTKCTIKWGNDFHFYEECFDDDAVYLSIDNACWEGSSEGITVTIPKAIWAVIRESAPVDLKYAKLSEEELKSFVEHRVDERIKRYNESEDSLKALNNIAGMMCYGEASSQRESQIIKGIEHYTNIQSRQKNILNKINEYTKK